ncbi:hypothetical protein FB00_12755 [Cellulosimicrobium funkei]|uniref:DUF732 domain-containing protein n=1 Tax=Cellulosimicrobium funkei TaxID=264251 RepID=A0A0H2KML7_9MICO|nr:hypothetical protein [Cellulosimicrobium funkei]KLN34413.1 hypothetical protein FB00_12755 [Cellulosimicrobium funkei]
MHRPPRRLPGILGSRAARRFGNRLPATIGACALLLSVAACAAGPGPVEPTRTTAYERPAWMDEQLAEDARLVARQSRCLTERGVEFQTDELGGFYAVDPALATVLDDALDECTRSILGAAYRAPLTTSQLHGLYERQLDTRECLLAQGYSIPEPVSESDFVESQGMAWSAYEAFVEALGTLPVERAEAEQVRINAACPQPGLVGL